MSVGADVIKEVAKWLPLAWRLYEVFGGDREQAVKALRKLELEERKRRDERMGR